MTFEINEEFNCNMHPDLVTVLSLSIMLPEQAFTFMLKNHISLPHISNPYNIDETHNLANMIIY